VIKTLDHLVEQSLPKDLLAQEVVKNHLALLDKGMVEIVVTRGNK
jgi:hypothetical protein